MRPIPPFLSAALNAILKPDGLMKWKKRLVKDARLSLQFTEAMKIVRLTSALTDPLRLSSPKPQLRHGRRLALLPHPNLTLNLCTLSFVLSLALLLHLPLLLTFLTVPLPGSWLRLSPTTRNPTFPSPSQMPCAAEPEPTFPSSAEPCALRSLTPLSAPPFLPMNFSRLPQTSPPPLPLAQKKSPIPC